jgi:hypothetical protein
MPASRGREFKTMGIRLMASLPFTLGGVYADLAQIRGVARLDDDHLVLEYRLQDSVVGVLQSELKELRIPLSDLESIEFQRGFFRNVLCVRARTMRVLESLPGAHDTQLRLVCRRQDRGHAQQLATAVTLQLAERLLD